MTTHILAGYFTLTLFFANFFFFAEQRYYTHRFPVGSSSTLAAVNNREDDGFAHVFLYYPLESSAGGFSVFLNKKTIGKITSGGRIECRLLLEGPVAVTITEGNAYREPLTQSLNSRTISIKKGKSYYFRVSKNGALEYMFNAAKGEKSFAEAKDFVSQPVAYTETTESAIPLLTRVTN